ncbi:MAG: NUDIX hydrolase [Lachnospiraceae bacterium]|nr:NUDIX hydrolase [Lachnospiraceae bacterium]
MSDTEKHTEESLAWEQVSCEHLVQDEWIDFRRTAYKLPDGSVFSPFYSYSRRDFVVIVAIDTQGRLICVKQYRQGLGEVTTEFCAGGIERDSDIGYRRGKDDETSAEAALDAAKRELREETGYVSDDWTHLLTEPANATLADNYAHIFLARGCKKQTSQELDDTEFLNVLLLTPEEVEELIRTGGFQQAIHVLAWFMAKDRYDSRHA